MTKLNQILGVEKGVKTRTEAEITKSYQLLQKPDLFAGVVKTYEPLNEEGEKLLPESKNVQLTVSNVMDTVKKNAVELFDVVFAKELGNTNAKADVVVDGETILTGVPATYLLFLEKQLIDIRTIVSAIPVTDTAEEWKFDVGSGLYRGEERQTHRTKKVQKPIVLSPATDKFPAQTQLITEDELVGYWKATRLSGGFAPNDKTSLLEKVNKLIDAVRAARQVANDIELPKDIQKVGAKVLNYLV